MLKLQAEEMVVDGQATNDVEQVKEVTEFLHAQQTNHSDKRGSAKERYSPVVGKVGKVLIAEKMVRSLIKSSSAVSQWSRKNKGKDISPNGSRIQCLFTKRSRRTTILLVISGIS